MNRTRRTTTFLTALVLGLAGSALAQDAAATASDALLDDPVVLRLGAETWTQSEIDERFELSMRSIAAGQGVELTPEIRAQLNTLKPQFLEGRAREVVLVAEARERGLTVSEAAIDEQVDGIRAGFEDETDFLDLLEGSGIGSEERLRALIRENEMIGALMESVRNARDFSDHELRTAYLSRRDVFRSPERVCASHILLENEADAEEAMAELDDGADFAEVAVQRSVGPTGPAGGELGCFERGRMVPEFEEAVFAGEVGRPFGPVETEFGQHLVLLTERQEERVLPFEDVRDEVAAALAEAAVQRDVEVLVATSGVVTYPERLVESDADGAAGGAGRSTPTPPVPEAVEPAAPAGD